MIVLSIEDDKSCRDLIRLHLLKFKDVFYNLEIYEATSLAEGYKIVEEREPDMILLDGDLPDSIPTDTIEQIPKLSTNAAVIILTNYEHVDMVISAMKNGAVDYINKKILADGKEFVRKLTSAWARFEADKMKQTSALSSPRIKRVTKELVDMARSEMTEEELRNLIEFADFAKTNFDDFKKKINKVYTAIYESNGTPSIKQQISTMTSVVQNLANQIESQEANRKENLKAHITGKWQFWAVVSPIALGAVITILSKIISVIWPAVPQ